MVAQTLPHSPQLLLSVASSTQAPLQICWDPGQAHCPAMHKAPVAQTFLQEPQFSVSVASSTQAPLQICWNPRQAHRPAIHEAPVAQTFSHAPQFAVSVLGFTQSAPHVRPPQEHIPAEQMKFVPLLAPHAWSTAGSLSTMPSQSLSLPSQISATGVHWQTLLVWPSMAPQVQPGTQVDAVAQLVVHTFVPFPSGRQMPLGQSEFLLHGVPVAPV